MHFRQAQKRQRGWESQESEKTLPHRFTVVLPFVEGWLAVAESRLNTVYERQSTCAMTGKNT
jgi:hypothetical protein